MSSPPGASSQETLNKSYPSIVSQIYKNVNSKGIFWGLSGLLLDFAGGAWYNGGAWDNFALQDHSLALFR